MKGVKAMSRVIGAPSSIKRLRIAVSAVKPIDEVIRPLFRLCSIMVKPTLPGNSAVGVGIHALAPTLPTLDSSLINAVAGKLEEQIRRYEFVHRVEFRPIEPVSHYRAGFVECVEAFC